MTGDTARSSPRLFVTYARGDRDLVDRLAAGLQRLGHEVWLDKRLSVGQEWWAEILNQIRLSEAIVVALSPALLESPASAAERGYAVQLGKVLLPVCVRPVRNELLPPDLAPLQIVDYCAPGPDAAFELADALAHLPASPALPDPQPKPPPIPVSYMSGLSAQVHAPSLTLDQQLAVIAKLEAALKKPAERDAALELLASLQSREDLYHTPGAQIEAVLAKQIDQQEKTGGAGQESGNAAADSQNAVPANWYSDPYHRHQLRWFDRVWTDWACDGSRVVKDPVRH